MPVCGQRYLKYGGSTTCFSIHTPDTLIVFDAGTGISLLLHDLVNGPEMPAMTLFFTHFHMDHVVGLPCFDPLYRKDIRISIMADPRRADDWKQTLQAFLSKPYWPVGLGECAAGMTMTDLPVTDESVEISGVRISWFRVPHPQQCLAYRAEMPGRTIVISTDVEYTVRSADPKFIEFCQDADFLVFDGQYAPEEYERYRNWGHSTWEAAASIAEKARIGRLVLTHHAPDRIDSEIDRIVERVREVFPRTWAATENMVLDDEQVSDQH